MDEQNRDLFPQDQNEENTVEQPCASQKEEMGEQAEPAAEQAAAEQQAFEETAQEPAADPSAAGQSFWQGGYYYQNPNPYQNYENPWQAPQKKKDRNLPFIIAAVFAGVIMLICCVVITVAQVIGIKQTAGGQNQEGSVITETPADQKQPSKDQSESPAKREEGTVYNAPEITNEKKKGEALSLTEINKKVKDSVVGILVSQKAGEETKFSGSGFIISKDGYIISNEHVIADAAQVKVVLSDGITEYNAVIVGKDTQSDLAILKVEAKDLSPAELGDSDELEVGETVVAIGNPYGMVLAGSMTDGIVSALNRKIEINGSFMTLIQTNASINPGNSGGPLVNAYGQVVGICSSKLVATDYEGIGFAIPINDVADIAEELINHGYLKTRAYIGIMGSDLTENYCKYHDLPQGIYVSYVDPECDAAKKGLKEEDIIIGFNGEEITSMAQLNELKNEFRPGDQVTIKVWRNKKEFEIKITLTESNE